MSHLLHLAAAAAVGGEDEETAASPGRGGELGDEDAPMVLAPHRSYEGRQKSNLPRSEASLVMRTRKSQLLCAAAEGEEVVTSLGGRHRDQDIPMIQVHCHSSEGNQRSIPRGGVFMVATQGQVNCCPIHSSA